MVQQIDRDYIKCRKMSKIMEKISAGKDLICCIQKFYRDDFDIWQSHENQLVRMGVVTGSPNYFA